MNKVQPKRVLLAGDPSERELLDELGRGLRRLGHTVSIALNTEEALGQATPDTLVVTETSGSSLFQAFNLPTGAPHGIFLSPSLDFEAAALATSHGASQVLGAPTIDELANAVERTPRCRPIGMQRELVIENPGDNDHTSVLELLAFATQLGLNRSLRLRIGTAASELMSLVHSSMTITAGLVDDPLGIDRLILGITSHTERFDRKASSEWPSRMDFARTLCERLDLSSDQTQTTMCAEFTLAPTHFEDDPANLDELDYFNTSCLREIYSTLGDPDENNGRDLLRLSPGSAAVLMRVKAAGQCPQAALFSASVETNIQS